MTPVERLEGVYRAAGGLHGAATYMIDRLFGSGHCALRGITHSKVRRKPAWDEMVARPGVPFHLAHRNEWPQSVPRPVVLGFDGTTESVLLGPWELEAAGSVPALESPLRAAVARAGLSLPTAAG